MEQTKTELHTHLMGILPAEKFLGFLSQYTDCIYWPIDGPISNASQTIPIASALYDKEVLDSLRIQHGTQVDYLALNNMYATRTELLKLAVHKVTTTISEKLADEHLDIAEDKEKKIIQQQAEQGVYNNYINCCLEELVSQGVKYVEISYSNFKKTLGYSIREDLKDKITCKFLLSTDRSRSTRTLKQQVKDLRKAMDSGYFVGVDIMGLEVPFSEADLDYNNSRSFQKKLEILFDELRQHDNTTLRIHSGEVPNTNNTIITLQMINQIAETKGIVIPPPEIRIGHGIHFTPSKEYLNLLKKFQCVVEINASSNFGLKNIQDYQDIPYNYYLENEIPIVLTTDGHGMYDTTIKQENEIAKRHTTPEQYETILKIDDDILERKVK